MGGTGVLCMAYGSPRAEADVEAYFTHIRGGRPPSPEALAELQGRYRAIGRSPLEEITRRQAAALGGRLGVPAFAAMKHSPPFIADGAEEARAAGVERLIGLPLAPHFAHMSVGQYEEALLRAWTGPLELVHGFHDDPVFIGAIEELLREVLDEWEPDRVFFTAHSLPCRVVEEGDPYDERLLETCRLVEARFGDDGRLPPWEFAFQSASHTGVPWLGPDLLDAMERSGTRRPLICPIGFVADHLEILYDIDVEAQAWAHERGVELRRTASFNDRPCFIDALEAVVRPRLRPAGSTQSSR